MNDDILADLDPELLALVLGQEEESIPTIDGNSGPLSFLQEKIFSLQSIAPDSTAYNMPVVFKVTQGHIDADKMAKALTALIAKHDTFRTQFIAGTPTQQQVITDFSFKLEQRSVACVDTFLAGGELVQWLNRPFDLTAAPLVRALLIESQQGEQLFAVNYHHLVSDGWSNTFIIRDLMLAYRGLNLGETELRYIDYTSWQETQISADNDITTRWQAYLSEHQLPLSLPVLKEAGKALEHRGSKCSKTLNVQSTERLQQFCQAHQVTPFSVTLALWQIVLARYSGHRQFNVGVPNAARNHEQIQELVGCFITTHAYRCEVQPERSFLQTIKAIQAHVMFCMDQAQPPFEYVQDTLQLQKIQGRHPLFQAGFDCQQKEDELDIAFGEFTLSPMISETTEAKHEISMMIQLAKDSALVEIEYRDALFDSEFIEQLMNEYTTLFDKLLAAPNCLIADVFVEPHQHSNMLQSVDKDAARLFIERLESRGHSTALSLKETALTYSELAKQANQLARYFKAQGIGCEDKVGVYFERDFASIVTMLAAWQVGAAYVPLDTNAPKQRVIDIIEQSDCKCVMTRADLADKHLPRAVGFDSLALDTYQDTALACDLPLERLAYVIFTSGSTGVPKGVCVSHKALAAHLQAMQTYYQYSTEDTCLVSVSFSFDASIEQIWGPLLAGAQLILDEIKYLPEPELHALVAGKKVSVLGMTPAYLRYLHTFPTGIRLCIVGGEAWASDNFVALSSQQPNTLFVNAYGPSETVITPTVWLGSHQPMSSHYMPLGEALGDRQLFILDSALTPVPEGVIGELYIAGTAVARGYLAQAGLTAQSFIANPFSEDGSRIYRTGDLVRVNPAGMLEFISRVDHQIKIRGYRIELGEVEAQLLRIAGVNEAIVVAQEYNDSTHLIAYISGEGLESKNIKAQLMSHLPDYMVPSLITVLAALPLNQNGKVDRKALPEPVFERSGEFAAPEGEVEQVLAQVWQKVLSKECISRDDNFFELGGDSIISLQIVAQLRQTGYVVSAKEMFNAQTIAQLTPLVQSAENALHIEQDVSGDVPLLPIQQHFFRQDFTEREHWNQSVLLELDMPLKLEVLRKALSALLTHHDALRLQYQQTQHQQWRQSYQPYNEAWAQNIIWQREVKVCDITAVAEQAQASFAFDGTPLIRLVHMKVDDGTERLLVVCHHLIVDGVSWRILLADLQQAYAQALQGQAISLMSKSHSYQYWAKQLNEYPTLFADESSYWLAQSAAPLRFPAFNQYGSKEVKDTQALSVQLSAEVTKQLLQGGHKTYSTQVNDILLSALSEAIYQWLGQSEVLINMEGHGREPWDGQTDLSRTVGWFTALYPVKVARFDDWKDTVQVNKETLRTIPNKGLGYGVLRYLGSNDAQAQLQAQQSAQIEFNYLGQFDNSFDERDATWYPAKESAGSNLSGQYQQPCELVINSQVFDGKLNISVRFGEQRLQHSDIEDFLGHYENAISAVLEHCKQASFGLSPSDLPLSQLTQCELDSLAIAHQNIDNIYPLSAMQKGMFFHALHGSRTAYVNQMRLDVNGLNVDKFKAAWCKVVARHDVLRTGFLNDFDQPLQYVLKHVNIDQTWCERDVIGLSDAQYQSELDAQAKSQLLLGFDVEQEVGLNRLVIITKDDNTHHIIWTSHHILSDGWSRSLLMGELLAAYQGNELTTQVKQYVSYIEYLQAQDLNKNLQFWQTQVAKLQSPSYLAGALPAGVDDAYKTNNLVVNHTLTSQLEGYAKKHRVTLNTLVQGLWGVLLSRYLGQQGVCFGATTAGRPVELSQSELIQGLFINTIPVFQHVDEALSLSEWFQSLQSEALQGREHESTPLYEIQKLAKSIVHGGEANGLFDTLLVFENYPIAETLKNASPNETVFDIHNSREENNYPLTLTVGIEKEMMFKAAYSTNELSCQAVSQLMQSFHSLIEQLVDGKTHYVGDLALSVQTDRSFLSQERSQQRAFVSSLLTKFKQVVIEKPKSTALRHEQTFLDYAELDTRSNQLAHYLIAQGMKSEDKVGLVMRRGIDMVVSMLAVLKAGGVYVPLAPSLPAERVSYICEHSELTYALCNTAHSLPEQVQMWSLDDTSIASHSIQAPQVEIESEQLAYVLYTSGSTGKPKGVAISHGNLSNFISSMSETFDSNDSHSWLALTSLSFDISGLEIYLPLLHGSTLVIVDSVSDVDTELLSQVTHVQATPAGWRSLLAQEALGQRLVGLCGGEALPERLAQDLKAHNVTLFNMYGPTETTIWSSCHAVIDSIHLGEAISNTQLYVLDSALNLCPPQVQGELYIAGEGLARGYLARPDLTAERFVANPYGEQAGSRLYRTGDNVRWNAAGELEYLGRVDHQVKVRGFRIELGEIEAVLDSHNQVRAAVVVADETAAGTRLVAYVESDEVEQSELTTLLVSKLPEYMVPSVIMVLEALPLNSSGKVDRKALPKAEVQAQAFVAPQSAHEQTLAEIWQTVLGAEQVGRHDNFFALGGDSISSLRVTALAKQHDLHVPVDALFASKDLAQLASRIEDLPLEAIEIARLETPFTGLSYAQQRQWFLWKLDPSSAAYHISGAMRLEGMLDIEALKGALTHLMTRHDSLRTQFIELSDGEVQQQRLPEVQLTLEIMAHSHEARQNVLNRPFDLTAAQPLIRFALLQHSDEAFELVMVLHHIIADGWSVKLLIDDFVEAYELLKQGGSLPSESQALRYSDYAHWQKLRLEGGEEQRQLSYWQEKLGDEHGVLPLPYDQVFDGSDKRAAAHRWTLPSELKGRLQTLAQQQGSTLFSVLMSAWQTVLYRFSGESHIKVGMPVANRQYTGCEGIVGMFVNTQAIATQLNDQHSLGQVLEDVAQNLREAQAHQDIPFEKLVDGLDVPRDTHSSPIFQVMMNHQQLSENKLASLSDLTLEVLTTERQDAQFDLNLNSFEDANRQLQFTLEYFAARFSSARINTLVEAFNTVLSVCADAPKVLVSELELLTDETQNTLLKKGQGQTQTFNASVLSQFTHTVQQYGDAVAVRDAKQSVSYAQLDSRSNQLAHYLIAQGVKREDKVGLVMRRGIDMVVSMLAVLKAGGVYVPLAPSLPAERVSYICEHSELTYALCNTAHSLPEQVQMWSLDDTSIASHSIQAPQVEIESEQLAYVLYTSGSTGKPKGVAISHGNLSNFISSMSETFDSNDSHSWLALTSLSFDISGLEIYLPLLHGSTLVIVDSVSDVDTELLSQVTHVQATPAGWRSLLAQEALGQRLVGLCGGEALPERLAQDLKAHNVTLFNMYGPTETTIWSSCHAVIDSIHLGEAISNTQLYVLDSALNLCPPQVQGELYIAGEGLARGYLARPDLTAERFVANPYGEQAGSRLYRTGDNVRWNAAGELEYLGRVDHQVKVRGFRIELGEIEAVLDSHNQVRAAVVVADETAAGTRLVAYVESDEVEQSELTTLLVSKLPEYMVPSVIMVLEALPLNSSGKVDRKALPKAEVQAQAFVAPQSAHEQTLAEIWQTVLGAEQVGRHDNFFALGGDSISSLRVTALAKQHDLHVPVDALFASKDLAQLASRIEDLPLEAIEIARLETPFTGLSYAQQRQWFLWKLDPSSAAYHISSGLMIRGALDISVLEQSINALLSNHETLKVRFVESNEGEVSQYIASDSIPELMVYSEKSTIERAKLKQDIVARPFDLTSEPLIRIALIQMDVESYELVLVMHHIISDGWSFKLIIDDLIDGYVNPIKGLPYTKLKPKLRYSDFAAWQKEWLTNGAESKQLEYWQETLGCEHPILNLPFKKEIEKGQLSANSKTFNVSTSHKAKLAAVSAHSGGTLFAALMSAWQIALYRFSGQNDIRVGIPVANRNIPGTDDIVGMFVNSLVIKTNILGSLEYQQVLEQVIEAIAGAQESQDIPFERLVDKLQVERSTEHHPLFQVMMNHQRYEQDGLSQLSELQIAVSALPDKQSQFPLILNSIETAQGELQLSINYDSGAFQKSTIDALMTCFTEELERLRQAKETLIGSQTSLDKTQMSVLLSHGQGNANVSESKCLIDTIRQAAIDSSNLVAVTDNNRSLSYQQLDEQSERLANFIMGSGVALEQTIAIMFSRDIDMLVSIVAVLRAGAAYVPVDPGLPQERQSYILKQANIVAVLTNQIALNVKTDIPVWRISELDLASIPEQAVDRIASPGQLAYVLFTSGSTGKPKGVAVTHKGLRNYLGFASRDYAQNTHNSLVSSTLSFDATVTSLLTPLYDAKTVHLLAQSDDEVSLLAAHIQQASEPYLYKITPAHIVALLNAELLNPSSLAHCFVIGGDKLLSSAAQRLQNIATNARLINEYGPTETVVGCSIVEVNEQYLQDYTILPITQAIDNTQLFVLDDDLNLCPADVAGELYIAGDGLARGYIGRADLSAERFIANPFSEQGERLYRTGDRVKRNSNNELEYIGRTDFQVKIRGFRIELGEIEAQLCALANVDESVVMAEPIADSHRLVAYLVGDECDDNTLQQMLKSSLPEYMVPNIFVWLSELPLNINGKLDRKALPAVVHQVDQFVAPQGEIEEQITTIWGELLQLDTISRDANFFTLGGDSIIALRVISVINHQFNIELNIKSIFSAATIMELAEVVLAAQADGKTTRLALKPAPQLEPVQISQEQRSLWLTDRLSSSDDKAAYNIAGGVILAGELDLNVLEKAFNSVIERQQVFHYQFVEHDGEARLQQRESITINIPVIDLSIEAVEQTDKELQAEQLRHVFSTTSFDLENDLLIRIKLIKIEDDVHHLLVNMHHIVSDGWSISNFVKEVGTAYSSYLSTGVSSLPLLTVQYSDYARWQQQRIDSEEGEQVRQYWQSQLKDAPLTSLIPQHFPRGDNSTEGDSVPFVLSASQSDVLRAFTQQHNLSLYSVLLATYNVMLCEATGQTDFVLGTDLSGRDHLDLEPLIGYFIKVLPIRAVIDKNAEFVNFAKSIQNNVLDLQAHQLLTLESIVQITNTPRQTDISPIFQQLFVMQNTPAPYWPVADVAIENLANGEAGSKFDSAIFIQSESEAIVGSLLFKKALYSKDKMQSFVTRWQSLAVSLFMAPNKPMSEHLQKPKAKKIGKGKFSGLKKS
ncbi:amino acid adenylation domain-containing protein [Pseudoalteromonas neustonica]|uniref:Amino acid adenylation domain-containing protein n=1 Tax=Pseudoalteromonas neustonica TaxID=1840331 RepID=A0ABU9U016_9GAMM